MACMLTATLNPTFTTTWLDVGSSVSCVSDCATYGSYPIPNSQILQTEGYCLPTASGCNPFYYELLNATCVASIANFAAQCPVYYPSAGYYICATSCTVVPYTITNGI